MTAEGRGVSWDSGARFVPVRALLAEKKPFSQNREVPQACMSFDSCARGQSNRRGTEWGVGR